MKVYSTAEFARKHGVSNSRIRQLIAEDRVFPRQRLDNGRYIMFANSVIVAPYERTNRKLRGVGWILTPPQRPQRAKRSETSPSERLS